jgi:hypothetical protein
MNCTASVGLIAKEGRHSTNAAAEEGTAAHTVLELELWKGLVKAGLQAPAGVIEGLEKEVEEFNDGGV